MPMLGASDLHASSGPPVCQCSGPATTKDFQGDLMPLNWHSLVYSYMCRRFIRKRWPRPALPTMSGGAMTRYPTWAPVPHSKHWGTPCLRSDGCCAARVFGRFCRCIWIPPSERGRQAIGIAGATIGSSGHHTALGRTDRSESSHKHVLNADDQPRVVHGFQIRIFTMS